MDGRVEDADQQHTVILKCHQSPPVDEHQIKRCVQDLLKCNPDKFFCVPFRGNGRYMVGVPNRGDADKLLEMKEIKLGQYTLTVSQTPLQYFQSMEVLLNPPWLDRKDFSFSLLKEIEVNTGLSATYQNKNCTFKGNFCQIQSAHDILEKHFGGTDLETRVYEEADIFQTAKPYKEDMATDERTDPPSVGTDSPSGEQLFLDENHFEDGDDEFSLDIHCYEYLLYVKRKEIETLQAEFMVEFKQNFSDVDDGHVQIKVVGKTGNVSNENIQHAKDALIDMYQELFHTITRKKKPLTQEMPVEIIASLQNEMAKQYPQVMIKVNSHQTFMVLIGPERDVDAATRDFFTKLNDALKYQPQLIHRLNKEKKKVENEIACLQSELQRGGKRVREVSMADVGASSSQLIPEPFRMQLSTGLAIVIATDDITQQVVDAIVNAANGYLNHGAGLAKAIATAAGPILIHACRKVIQDRGNMSIGVTENVVTTAGSLPAGFVIHAVGPRAREYTDQEVLFQDLKKTFSNCIQRGLELGVASIAIPAISCGIFGVDVELVARSMAEIVYEFNASKPKSSIQEIRVVNLDQEINYTIQAAFEDVFKDQLLKEDKTMEDHKPSMSKTEEQSSLGTQENNIIEGIKEPTGTPHDAKNDKNCDPLPDDELEEYSIDHTTLANESKDDTVPQSPTDPIGHSTFEKGSKSDPAPQSPITDTPEGAGAAQGFVQIPGPLKDSNKSHSPTGMDMYSINSVLDSLGKNDGAVSNPQSASSVENNPVAPQASDTSCVVCCSKSDTTLRDCNHYRCKLCIASNNKCTKCNPASKGNSKLSSKRSRAESTNPVHGQVETSNDQCPICFESLRVDHCVQLDCGHRACKGCLDQHFQQKLTCPVCMKVLGVTRGNQPPGTMYIYMDESSLPGFGGYTTIWVKYDMPEGVQNETHPNPGYHYLGEIRGGFLPNTREGREVCMMLKAAFDYGLVFTIGHSVTRGIDNCIIWNDIYHKTSYSGEYGYPDEGYLDRVRGELQAKGITPEFARKNGYIWRDDMVSKWPQQQNYYTEWREWPESEFV